MFDMICSTKRSQHLILFLLNSKHWWNIVYVLVYTYGTEDTLQFYQWDNFLHLKQCFHRGSENIHCNKYRKKNRYCLASKLRSRSFNILWNLFMWSVGKKMITRHSTLYHRFLPLILCDQCRVDKFP